MDSFHQGRSQGAPAMGRREVACLPSGVGSPLGRSRGRETPSLSKSVRFASFRTGRAGARTVSNRLMTPVLQAITPRQRNAPLTDEVPRCPRPSRRGVSVAYKSDTKGPPDAPATGRASPPPRPWGWRQRQSRGAGPRRFGGRASGSERQNLRVPPEPLRFTGPVSPAVPATKWPGGTSSSQAVGPLSNSPQQPKPGRAVVRSP